MVRTAKSAPYLGNVGYNRWKRWGDMGVFARMMLGLAQADADPSTLMIDATYLKAHRTASSLRLKKGGASA